MRAANYKGPIYGDPDIISDATQWAATGQNDILRQVADLLQFKHEQPRVELIRQSGLFETATNAIYAAGRSKSMMKTLNETAKNIQKANAVLLLSQLIPEAQEEGYPTPSLDAAIKAERVLSSIDGSQIPGDLDMYTTPDGEIAIDISGGYRKGLLFLFASDGSALVILTIDGRHRRAYYDDPPSGVDGFMSDALRDLNNARQATT